MPRRARLAWAKYDPVASAMHYLHRHGSAGSAELGQLRPIMVYSVEKLRITMVRKFNGIFQSPGAQVTNQFYRSELRQFGFS